MSKEKTENNIGIDGDVDGSFVGTNYGDVKIVKKVILSLFPPAESNQVDWDWAKGLLASQQTDIYKRLKDTLGQEMTLMDVSIAEQQQWVNRLQADRQLQVNGKNSGLLDPNRLLIETFGRNDIAGKLLILGAPGSGKTTALLSLAEQLVVGARSQSQTVIPVILELSTWREDSQSIEAWIVEQLYDLHGGNRKEKIYEKYLERQVLLPLLDGLDELGLERQKKCTEKLNEFARTYPQLVVCCRVREFETVNIKLSNLNGAICLQELSDGQIESYFQSINRADLWSEMKTNSALQGLLQETAEGEPGLLRVPLFIKLLADVYDPQEPIKNKADLLEKYIERQLSFDQRAYDRQKGLDDRNWAYKTLENEPKLQSTINSLSWIARQFQASNIVEFLIEQMQPNCIESKQLNFAFSQIVKLIYALIYGLIGGLIYGLITGLTVGVIYGLFGGLVLWLIVPLIFALGILVTGLGILATSLNVMDEDNWYAKLAEGLISILFAGMIIIDKIIDRIKKKLSVQMILTQSIWNSLQGLLWTTVLSYLLGMILGMIIFSTSLLTNAATNNYDWTSLISLVFPLSLKVGLICTLIFVFILGNGLACLQYLSLRLVLWQSGTIPWNFARFLNYCVERRLLLRVGGRYRFLHRELLDHFAQLPPGTRIK